MKRSIFVAVPIAIVFFISFLMPPVIPELFAFGPPCGAIDQKPCPGNKCAPTLVIRDGKCRVPCGGRDQNCCPANVCAPPNLCQNGKCKEPPPPCGGPDQNCCPAAVQCIPGYECKSSKCRVICGGLAQPCCPGNICLRADAACRNGQCVLECGNANQACCLDGMTCKQGNACIGIRCLPCGRVGLPCCPSGRACEEGFLCDGVICAQCGNLAQKCCSGNACTGGLNCTAGRCVQPPPSQVREAGQKVQAAAAKLVDWVVAGDEMKKATVTGMNAWKSTMTIKNVEVQAVAARIKTGSISGAPLEALMMAGYGPTATTPLNVRMAVARVIGSTVQDWFREYESAGAFYPAFAAWPGPQAPPTPNVPWALRLGSSKKAGNCQASKISAKIKENLGQVDSALSGKIDDYAGWFEARFLTFTTTAVIQNLLGSGPVPTFAPPAVPVVPVVNGRAECLVSCLLGNF